MLTVEIYNPSTTETIGPGRATVLPAPFDWAVIPPITTKSMPCTLDDLGQRSAQTGRTPAEGLQHLKQMGKIVVTFIDQDDDTDIPDRPYTITGIGPVGTGGGGGPVSALDITAFALSGPNIVEIGSSIINPAFTATYSMAPTSATINDGTGATPVASPLTSFVLPRTYTKTTINASQSWTVAATDGTNSGTATVTASWRALVYYGVAATPGSYTANFILTTIRPQGSALAASRQRDITLNATGLNKLYYAYPASFGGTGSNFIDQESGFPAGMANVGTISVSNEFGVVTPYYLWESDQEGLGAVVLSVT